MQIQTALRARRFACGYPCTFPLQLLPMLQKVQGQQVQRQAQGVRASQPELTPEEKERMHAFANRAVSEFAEVSACLTRAASECADACCMQVSVSRVSWVFA